MNVLGVFRATYNCDMPASTRGSNDTNDFPGQRLGLPETGVGSLAPMGPRILGLIIDWGIASLISWAWFAYDPIAIMVLFLGLSYLSIILLGGTIGHLVVGMRLNTVVGEAPGYWRPALRQVLLTLVVPALVVDEDGRGAHDVLSGLVLRRFR